MVGSLVAPIWATVGDPAQQQQLLLSQSLAMSHPPSSAEPAIHFGREDLKADIDPAAHPRDGAAPGGTIG
jgi:hypothetical protein